MPRLQGPVLSASSDLRSGSTLAARYRIERVIAKGGMASIYAAYDQTLERNVAVKVLRAELAMSKFMEWFLNEARTLAKLRGPHTTRVLDYGIERQPSGREVPYIVLELLRGVDLFTALQQNKHLSVPLAARYILEACEGLAEAHGLGIVHRDIKPENLFLVGGLDGTDSIKVLDFGISIGPMQLTQGHETVGSPLYMSPEQMCETPVDARSDIWSLGAVMYECVVGRPAFEGASVYEICTKILSGPTPDLSRVKPDLPHAFVNAVMRCLKRAPNGRFQNVAELARVLQPLADSANDSAIDRIERLLGIQPIQPAIETDEPVQVAGDDVKFTQHDIPGLQSRWGLAVVPFLAIASLVLYLHYQYPNDAAGFPLAVWQRLTMLADSIAHWRAL